MNKSFRQGQILEVVRSTNIGTQDDLARELAQRGIQATQVTLSRDIRDLGLVKTSDGYRQMPAERSGPDLALAVAEFLRDIKVAQNLVVLKTDPGTANSLAIAIDHEGASDVVGTVAGDDTVLVVSSDTPSAEHFRERILALLTA